MRKSGVPGAVLRCTLNRFAPGPLIVRYLLISNSPLVSVIVLFAGNRKVIVSPETELETASRNVHLVAVQLPVPSSAALFTNKVAASAGAAMSMAKTAHVATENLIGIIDSHGEPDLIAANKWNGYYSDHVFVYIRVRLYGPRRSPIGNRDGVSQRLRLRLCCTCQCAQFAFGRAIARWSTSCGPVATHA